MKKKIKWIVLGILGVIIVAVVAVVMNLNGIVRAAVEKGGTQSLALNTTLGNANIGLLSGDVSLGDLAVASPEGFTAPQMLSLGKVSVDTSYGKVFDEPVGINDVQIDRPKLVLEFKGMKSNLKTVADNLAARNTGDRGGQVPNDPNAKPVKLIVDHIKVSGAQIEIRSDLPIMKEPYSFTIPDVELSGIGNADGNRNGEEIGKVISQVITRLTIEAQKSGKLPPELAAILNGDLDQLINNIGGKFQEQAQALKAQAMQQVEAMKSQVQGQIQDVQKQAQEKIDDAKRQAEEKLKGLGGLGDVLGGKKEKPAPTDAPPSPQTTPPAAPEKKP